MPDCPDCVGLSEELRLTRLVLERGYVAVAVTAKSKGGCWGGDNDVEAIRTVLGSFYDHWIRKNGDQDMFEIDDHPTIYALGASSGGAMAAKLVAEKVAESAAVMVMGLRNQLLDKILSLPSTPVVSRKLYLAPMTRDKGTAKVVRENNAYWIEKQEEQGGNPFSNKPELIVDEISCLPLPVTADYLWNRVPGMTVEAAQTIIRVLLDHKHLDPSTFKLIIDPTKSNWRDFFLQANLPVPKTLQNASQQPEHKYPLDNYKTSFKNKDMVLWGAFDLTPAMSPLAKALHRAWAMHEYCSEIVEPALDFFEGRKTKQQTQDAIQERTYK